MSEHSPTHTNSSVEDLENLALDGEFSDQGDEESRFSGWPRKVLVGGSILAVAACIAVGVHALSGGTPEAAQAAVASQPQWSTPGQPTPAAAQEGGVLPAEPAATNLAPNTEAPATTRESEEVEGNEPTQVVSDGEAGAVDVVDAAPSTDGHHQVEHTWYAECVDKSWPDLEVHCGACTARVSHGKYNHTCDGYCKSIGQHCAGAWEPSGDGCDMSHLKTCSTPMPNTETALCQCVKSESKAKCAPHRGDCKETGCCAAITDTCFEKNSGWSGCRSSCAPGKSDAADPPQWQQPWTCRQTHAYPQAAARETYKWPDIVAVCTTGEVLVDPKAFSDTYDQDCQKYCRNGAARGQVGAEHWISMVGKGSPEAVSCPGEPSQSENKGVACSCSFPDRL
eukprot:TRINITY_DN19227_c0_g1_i1.p1 TRINITY_DN19227_c0_g1~~TRINITY_DN19227_c0_g1_i1.p1  ORF type:complete len:395 (+),score=55.14 TRINITY_DN19227_c0_g1_i1:84-1268(+)